MVSLQTWVTFDKLHRNILCKCTNRGKYCIVQGARLYGFFVVSHSDADEHFMQKEFLQQNISEFMNSNGNLQFCTKLKSIILHLKQTYQVALQNTALSLQCFFSESWAGILSILCSRYSCCAWHIWILFEIGKQQFCCS